MSYKNTILHRPGEKYPFLLATEADGIPLTEDELVSLKFECDVALRAHDEYKAMLKLKELREKVK